MAVLSVASLEERQPLGAQQKLRQCGSAHRRRAMTAKSPPSLGSGHGRAEHLPSLGQPLVAQQRVHQCASAGRRKTRTVNSPPSLGSGDGCAEYQPSVGLGVKVAELRSSDEHADASSSQFVGVAEKVAEKKQSERRDSSSEFPTNVQREHSWLLRLLGVLALLAFSLQWLYSQLEQDSKDYLRELGIFDDTTAADWYVLHRAGILSQQYKIREKRKPHPLVRLSQESGSRGCFFLDVPLLSSPVVVPIGTGSWRESAKNRLLRTSLPERVCQELAAGLWRLDGKAIATDVLAPRLVDRTLRITIPGLRGGMPPKKDYGQKSKAELVALCKERGMPHTHRGKDQLVEDLEEWDKHARSQKARERKAKPEALEEARKRMAKPEALEKDRERKAKPEAVEEARKRMAQPEALEEDRKRKAKPDALKAARKRMATPKEVEKAAARMAETYKGVKKKFASRLQYARADREREGAVVDGPGLATAIGSWQEASQIIAEAEGQQSLEAMPPSFAILNDEQCLQQVGEMYAFLEDVHWSTCVVCWRAWYNPNLRYDFEKTATKSGEVSKWFNPFHSVVLGCDRKCIDQWVMHADGNQREYAYRYLKSNYPPSVADSITSRLVDAEWKRNVVVCKMCLPDIDVDTGNLKVPSCTRTCDYVVDPVTVTSAQMQRERWQEHEGEHERIEDPRAYILGLSVEEFAPAVALLSDSEEMVPASNSGKPLLSRSFFFGGGNVYSSNVKSAFHQHPLDVSPAFHERW